MPNIWIHIAKGSNLAPSGSDFSARGSRNLRKASFVFIERRKKPLTRWITRLRSHQHSLLHHVARNNDWSCRAEQKDPKFDWNKHEYLWGEVAAFARILNRNRNSLPMLRFYKKILLTNPLGAGHRLLNSSLNRKQQRRAVVCSSQCNHNIPYRSVSAP